MTQDLAQANHRTRVRERREAAGFSQQALATKAGIATRTLARIEAGEDARLGTFQMIARALGCDVSDLLDEGAAA